MFGYKCFYRGKTCKVYALRTFDAQDAAAKIFKTKNSYEISVFLCEKDSKQVEPTVTF